MGTRKHFMVAGLDRIFRIASGTLILAIAYSLPLRSDWFAGLHFVASYPLLTGMAAWDPFYIIFELVRDKFIDYHFWH